MNKTIKFIVVTAALCLSSTVARADTAPINPGLINSDVNLGMIGPEADPYLEHYHGTPARYAHLYWSNVEVNGVKLADMRLSTLGPEADPDLDHYQPTMVSQNAAQSSIGLPGPEADPYLQHYQGTVSASNANAPIELIRASTWKLLDYEIVASDGTVSHPLGEDAVGYLLISPQNYAAVTISTNGTQKVRSFIHYVGKLNVDNDNSIHPFLSNEKNWEGVDQVKTWQFKDGRLTFTTPTNGFGGNFGQMVWELVR